MTTVLKITCDLVHSTVKMQIIYTHVFLIYYELFISFVTVGGAAGVGAGATARDSLQHQGAAHNPHTSEPQTWLITDASHQ